MIPRSRRYEIARFDEIPGTRCPCGEAKRAFVDAPEGTASMHVVEISADSRVHYHRRQTEIYYVLRGEGAIELDGERQPLTPGTAVFIRPGCRHRAVGNLSILNVVVPSFDPDDEWFDDDVRDEGPPSVEPRP